MKLCVLAVLMVPLMLSSALAQSARLLSQNKAFLNISGKSTLLFALCDALESPNIVAVTLPDAARKVQVYTFAKKASGEYSFLSYLLGKADPGAGNVYYPLVPRDGQPIPQDTVYALRQVNPGVLEDPAQALTPTWTSVITREVNSSCRYEVNTRLMGFSSKRSYLLTETPQGELRYQTFDFSSAASSKQLTGVGINRSSTPSLLLEGGSKQVTPTQQIFRFSNQGYTYTVSVPRLGQPAGARVTVTNSAGKAVVNDVLTGYVYSERR